MPGRRRPGSCMCGLNAGAYRCRYCQRLTCARCHHGDNHLRLCPTTATKETTRRR
jgi:hypothetical protein